MTAHPVCFLTNPHLEVLLDEQGRPVDDEFVVLTPLTTLLTDATREETTPGFITNFASIPRVLRTRLNVNGKSRRPAVWHDDAYCSGRLTRADADEGFRRLLVAEGMSETDAYVYWLGLRIGGWVPWNRRRKHGGYLREDFVSYEAFLAAGGE